MQSSQPSLILIRGLPGSGKTYLAQALLSSLGQDRVVMLDPDGTDRQSREYLEHVKSQTAEGVNPSLHAYRFLRAKAYQAIADHKIIVWNQPFTNLEVFKKMVSRLKERAKDCQVELPILVVEVEVNADAAKQRIAQRKQAGGHGPSGERLDQFVNDYKSFAGEGFRTVQVNGQNDVNKSVETVLSELNKNP